MEVDGTQVHYVNCTVFCVIAMFASMQVRAMTKRSKTGQVLGGSSNRLLKSPNNWISNPMLGPSPSPQDEMDGTNSRNRVRLYLSEGPVRILSAHVNFIFVYQLNFDLNSHRVALYILSRTSTRVRTLLLCVYYPRLSSSENIVAQYILSQTSTRVRMLLLCVYYHRLQHE